ncbi:MAG: UvrD-helicase domain-containing protein [Actinomycetota bacterium]|nr:UvrD-helicase domain-containing protein [Actinomycetota bacterium]
MENLAPISPGADAVERLLEELNPPQRRAVEHGEGPLLVIAGAGSGKTRVLTRRIAYLVATGQAHPSEILAITFTNKAAQEMRERVEELVGGVSRLMWVMTFHSACARLLRANAERLGYKRSFTIYDQADSLRMVKRCMEENEVDPKRFTPRSIQAAISGAKNRLQDSTDYAQAQGSYFEQVVSEVYSLYERRMVEASAMDFDDLLVRTVNLFELFADVRERYQRTFRWLLVDEYQDTNRAQYRLLQLLAGEGQNLTVVGDDAQCLVAGTAVRMADGADRPIELVRPGDAVLSMGAQGAWVEAVVSRVHRSRRSQGIRLTTASGRALVSTCDHNHLIATDRPEKEDWRPHSNVNPPKDARTAASTPSLASDTPPWSPNQASRSATALLVRPRALEFRPVPAQDLEPGMSLLAAEGALDPIEALERIILGATVHDLDVTPTHNFVANGLVTHNSIYSFRSADVRNILEFEHDFQGAEVVKLEQNYRSTGTILDAANAVIANNTEQKQKNLWTDAERGEPVVVAELDDEHAEARYVAGEIERLVSDEAFGRDDVAVFYRMNAQSRVLEDTLVRYEVPYQVIGGTKFYERAEVKDAIAYLSLLANPADAISFTRVINSPRRGIGRQTEARILSHANTTGEDVWDVMSRPEGVPGLGAAAVKAVHRFAAVMAGLRERAEGDSVAELLESVLHDTGYFDSLEAERTLEAEGRMENLQELVGVAGEFDVNRRVEGEVNSPLPAGAPLRPSDSASQGEDTPLEEFLAQIRLFTEQDGIRDAESLITLMSLHNAKGLEYDAAFIIGCEEGVFPHARSVEEGNLEEERRLAYVGVTRAKQRLYMTCARRRSLHGTSGWNSPSRFLREVPAELTEHKAMAIETGWQSGGTRQGSAVRGFGGRGEFRAPDRAQPQTPEVEFRVGDDVVHASFGEGVVTSVEPGSVVVVRFASEGGERKLMADYAPLKKAS